MLEAAWDLEEQHLAEPPVYCAHACNVLALGLDTATAAAGARRSGVGGTKAQTAAWRKASRVSLAAMEFEEATPH